MASLNRVVIMGNLGQDPELRYTQGQAAVCTLRIATTETWTGADGQRQEQTEWHQVVVWNKQAENCAKYLAKGRSVLVEGRLRTRSWEDQKTGQKRYTTEIVAQNIQFVGGGQQREGAPRERPAGAQMGGMGGMGETPRYGGQGGGSGSSSRASTTPDFTPDMSDFGGPSTPGLDDIPF